MSHNFGCLYLRPLNSFEVEKVNLILRAPALHLKDISELRGFVCLMTVGFSILFLFFSSLSIKLFHFCSKLYPLQNRQIQTQYGNCFLLDTYSITHVFAKVKVLMNWWEPSSFPLFEGKVKTGSTSKHIWWYYSKLEKKTFKGSDLVPWEPLGRCMVKRHRAWTIRIADVVSRASWC